MALLKRFKTKKKSKPSQKVHKKKKLSAYERKKKILQIYRGIGHTNITKTALAKELGVSRHTLDKDLANISDEIAKIPAQEINFEFDVIKEYISEQARKIATTSSTDATKVSALKLILDTGERSIKIRQMLGIIDQPTQKHEIQANDFSTFYDEYFSKTKKSDKK
jgi:predicted flap endonuclease-1-like 5' DNA nuclease